MSDSFDTPEEALEHFGVRGMKWGVRRSSSSNKTDHTLRNEAVKIGAGVALGVGTVVVLSMLHSRGSVSLSSTAQSLSKGKDSLKTLSNPLSELTIDDVHAQAKKYWGQNRELAKQMGLDLKPLGL